jgi:uncharacterized alpha-E superfamily protein
MALLQPDFTRVATCLREITEHIERIPNIPNPNDQRRDPEEINELRVELKEELKIIARREIRDLFNEFKAELRQDFRRDMKAFGDDLKREYNTTANEMRQRLDGFSRE